MHRVHDEPEAATAVMALARCQAATVALTMVASRGLAWLTLAVGLALAYVGIGPAARL